MIPATNLIRFARALLAAGGGPRRTELERVVVARPPAPPIARSGALIDLAALIASAGERERARDPFQRPHELFLTIQRLLCLTSRSSQP